MLLNKAINTNWILHWLCVIIKLARNISSIGHIVCSGSDNHIHTIIFTHSEAVKVFKLQHRPCSTLTISLQNSDKLFVNSTWHLVVHMENVGYFVPITISTNSNKHKHVNSFHLHRTDCGQLSMHKASWREREREAKTKHCILFIWTHIYRTVQLYTMEYLQQFEFSAR